MSGPRSRFDDVRAVTINDTVASAALIAFTVVVGGGLGLGLALSGGGGTDGAPSANFSFEYVSQSNLLFVTMEGGDPIRADELVVQSGRTEKTWATVADTNNSSMISTGDTIALGANSPFGKAITGGERVIVRWERGNQTKRLANWTAQNG